MSPPEVVSSELLSVLRQLQSLPELGCFYLVGGTALALQLAHRRSIDIDLFTDAAFDSQRVADCLTTRTPAAEIETAINTVRCFISGIKVDLLAHQYPLLESLQVADGIRMASLPDIAAMKLNAVANRGAKKDFWDIAVLLSRYSLGTMVDFHARKYRSANRWAVIKSLCYFADADRQNTPIVDFTGMTWETVKARIRPAATELLRASL